MTHTLFFYDLETSGLSPRSQRVMQFAGQRTDMELNPIGEPVDILVKLSEDILPDPQAILVTGTTPQKTLEEGISEPEFARFLVKEIFTEGTIAVGFNNVRFDDEFVRHTLWRNFYDPYEWSWSEGRGRWDILDVVRMTRALRPEGIKWPVADDGSPVNKLELLSKVNHLEHTHAHDALSDVEATIQVAKLIRSAQPKLYEYLFSMRQKNEVAKLVNPSDPKPFVYSSGKYGRDNNFTTIAIAIAEASRPGAALVYDLRHDPKVLQSMSVEDIKHALFATREERKKDTYVPIPVKEIAYNKCPAIAPLGVMNDEAWQRINLTQETIEKHMKNLTQDIVDKLVAALSDRPAFVSGADVEEKLYDGFGNKKDTPRIEAVRVASENELADFHPEFIDERLAELLLRYKGRNFPRALSEEEQTLWQQYRTQKFAQATPAFVNTLQKIARETTDETTLFLLQELHLWWEATAPTE